MKSKFKTWVVAAAAILLVTGLLAGVKASQIGKMAKAGKSFTPVAETISTAAVEEVQWGGIRTAVGTLVAVRGVVLGAELPGLIRGVHFESGATVAKGSVLVKLDTSTEEAQLESALAEAQLARINLERARSLRQGESNTQADLDAAVARSRQAEAAVSTLRATIAKKTIRAPFAGRIAIRQVELGQVVQSGSAIASLQSIDPIYAELSLPQQALADLKLHQRVRMRVDIFPNSLWEGEITTINPEVDVSTRSVRVRATFPNTDGRLRPGMFSNVEVLSGEKRTVVIVPATAVLFAPYGDSVYVLEEQRRTDGSMTGVARQRFVRLGERRGDYVAILSGLKTGETVVSSGAFKLRNGAAVTVNNALAPTTELTPDPTDK